MTEQNRDATEYAEAAARALRRRLDLLEDAYKRGVHTDEEFQRLWNAIVGEQGDAWGLNLDTYKKEC